MPWNKLLIVFNQRWKHSNWRHDRHYCKPSDPMPCPESEANHENISLTPTHYQQMQPSVINFPFFVDLPMSRVYCLSVKIIPTRTA